MLDSVTCFWPNAKNPRGLGTASPAMGMEGSRMLDEGRESLALQVQVCALIATVALTYLCRRRKSAPAVGLVMGFMVNVVSQIAIAGGGPGACVGFFIFPLYGWLASHLTLRVVAWRHL